jgi:hypothetical protein
VRRARPLTAQNRWRNPRGERKARQEGEAGRSPIALSCQRSAINRERASDSAQAAKRDPRASKPDEQVWLLTCTNARYRVRLVPDMAAAVEQIH